MMIDYDFAVNRPRDDTITSTIIAMGPDDLRRIFIEYQQNIEGLNKVIDSCIHKYYTIIYSHFHRLFVFYFRYFARKAFAKKVNHRKQQQKNRMNSRKTIKINEILNHKDDCIAKCKWNVNNWILNSGCNGIANKAAWETCSISSKSIFKSVNLRINVTVWTFTLLEMIYLNTFHTLIKDTYIHLRRPQWQKCIFDLSFPNQI